MIRSPSPAATLSPAATWTCDDLPRHEGLDDLRPALVPLPPGPPGELFPLVQDLEPVRAVLRVELDPVVGEAVGKVENGVVHEQGQGIRRALADVDLVRLPVHRHAEDRAREAARPRPGTRFRC